MALLHLDDGTTFKGDTSEWDDVSHRSEVLALDPSTSAAASRLITCLEIMAG